MPTDTTLTNTSNIGATTGQESNLSNWAGPYVTDMLAKGQALSEMPYEQYQGALTAGPSQLQHWLPELWCRHPRSLVLNRPA